jgi:hypothetical protein
MSLSYGKILDECDRLMSEAGCNTGNPYQREALTRINQIIGDAAEERDRELRPDARDGSKIPLDMEMPSHALFQILRNVDGIFFKEEIGDELYYFLPPEERGVYMRFLSFFSLYGVNASGDGLMQDETLDSLVRLQILPHLNPNSVLWPVMQAFLENKDFCAVMKKIISDKGGEIKRKKRPAELEAFIGQFRAMISQHIGVTGQA